MENKQFPSNKKLISIQEEKLIREFDYDSTAGAATFSPKKQLFLEILHQSPGYSEPTQKVLVSIKQKAPPIKTLYIAEKSHYHSKKSSDRSGSRLAIGDHSSFTTSFSKDNPHVRYSIAHNTQRQETHPASDLDAENYSSSSSHIKSSSISKCSCCHKTSKDACEIIQQQQSVTKCYEYEQPPLTMNISKVDPNIEKIKTSPKKVDIATLVVTSTPSKDTLPTFSGAINKLHRRIDHLERKILKQEMVFRMFDPNIVLSSSDEEVKDNVMRTTSGVGRPGCSYIEYSHIPESSAFQRYSHQGSPLSPSKATTLEKEHNSEQYGRDFTTYDGITARGKRQCASVPCKRDDIPKVAAERVHKIRHKLNPVRDYRLMDTVHYLAQGEFAPRDDGIKLTPSREAVLSDIIWEDVCRTHWPNTRLGRRVAHTDRYNTRGELQRLIDNLLRERVAHVERRKRRHYRIVKLNNRHENCRPVGKTGDIIVASHKNRPGSSRDVVMNDHKATSAVMSDRRRGEQSSRKNHRSYDRLIIPGVPASTILRPEDCSPGPSYAAYTSSNREPTNCYHNATSNKQRKNNVTDSLCFNKQELTSGSTISANRASSRQPRLVVKKDVSRRKNVTKEEPDLEHYILLPTLVVRTPSNMKRQKKFHELYHRILNVHINEVENGSVDPTPAAQTNSVSNKKDIGFNINITLSDTDER